MSKQRKPSELWQEDSPTPDKWYLSLYTRHHECNINGHVWKFDDVYNFSTDEHGWNAEGAKVTKEEAMIAVEDKILDQCREIAWFFQSMPPVSKPEKEGV